MNKLNEVNDKIIKEQEDCIKILKEISKDKDLIIQELKKQLSIHYVSQQRELLTQYNAFLNIQYPTIFQLDEDDIKDFDYWVNCG